MASSSVPQSSLLYACIAHHTTILSEHTASASSAASSLPSLVLPKVEHTTPQKLTYTHGPNFIHYIACAPSEFDSLDGGAAASSSAGGLTLLVVAPSALGRRVPFAFLAALRDRFFATHPPASTDFASLPAYGCASFNPEMKKMMLAYGSNNASVGSSGSANGGDAIHNVQSEIDGVRGLMHDNIERVLERGERIDVLVDKTDRLGAGAHDFRLRSRGLRRRMWWKNVKLMVLLGVVAVFLVYLFVGMACSLPGKSEHTQR